MPAAKNVGEPCAGGSSRQGCDPAGESPATSVVHVGREATPHPGSGNRPGDAWCERPGGPARKRRGRSSLEAERVQEPEDDRMTAATKYGSPRKLPCGDRSARRTRFPWGEAGVLGEGMDKCSRGARRGMGPSTCTRVAEIMSGRAIAQQGLARTCKDRAHNGHTGGAGRGMVWRMSPYEQRRGGNAPPGGFRGRPGAGNARSGQRGSGHSVATTVGYAPDTELGYAGPASWRRGEANSTASGRRVRQHRSFARWGKARSEKWRAEPRPEPDSGNPTVRDRRGASGNVASWSTDLHAARAPDFYLDNRTHGSRWRREETRPVGHAVRSRRLASTLRYWADSARWERPPGP